MEKKLQFPVADLTADEVSRLKQIEEDFRGRTGEEIVLIAYEHQKH